MTLTGLEQQNYFANNDIWIQIFGFVVAPTRVEINILNTSTGVTLPTLKIYSPDGIFKCNISLAVRAVMPEPDHLIYNNANHIKITFTAVYQDASTESIVKDHVFVRGGRQRSGGDTWWINEDTPLLISKWVTWRGINLPDLPQKFTGGTIAPFWPSVDQTWEMVAPPACDPVIVKFLNSLGGYQYWVFEWSEEEIKSKPIGSVARIAHRLDQDRIRPVGVSETRSLTLKTERVPQELQPILMDLMRSPDILIFDPQGVTNEGRWHRVEMDGNNKAVQNTQDKTYSNTLSVKLFSYINTTI